MAATGTPPPPSIAAEAALAVPGVAGLQPRLAHRLAAAASPTRPETTAERIPPEAGVRTDQVPDGSGWHIEVRCILTEGHRAVDTARNVHDQVRAAVLSYLAAHGAPVAVTVTVTVTVTRIAARDHTA
ncbi:Asp23/Gls24 family envelope stress response protein [Streptomyces sp. T1317-0309]|nr:Asp23/Gls24 family envelope stress response protein [Streptomyces sp. T1317-0309]